AGAEGVHRVRQAPLLADVLEQAGGHAPAEDRHQHRPRVAVLAEGGDPVAAEVDGVLLGGAAEAVRGERGDLGGGGAGRGRGGVSAFGAGPGVRQRSVGQLPAAAAQRDRQQGGELVVLEIADGGDHQVVGSVVLGEV